MEHYQLVTYLVNHINMEEREKIKQIILELNDSSNSELEYALNFLSSDYDRTKDAIIQLTKHLDGIEIIYNKILKEYGRRNVNQ